MNEIAMLIGMGVAFLVVLGILAYVADGVRGLKIAALTIIILPIVFGFIMGIGLLCGWLWRAQ